MVAYINSWLTGIFFFLWNWQLWPLALAIAISHGLIDIIKLYAQKGGNTVLWFLIDQLLHLGSIIGLYYLWFHPEWLIWPFWQSTVFWIYALAVVFLTGVAGVTIRILLTYWSLQLKEPSGTLVDAGKYIGILERLLTFVFILSGHWEAIGFLLAAKSVFRFGDLKESKDKKLTEYILIGTFLSFSIALATGMLVKYCLQVFWVNN